jgi:hypothetical protein
MDHYPWGRIARTRLCSHCMAGPASLQALSRSTPAAGGRLHSRPVGPAGRREDFRAIRPVGSATIDQMAQDGLEVAEFVLDRLHKRKIILLGWPWG